MNNLNNLFARLLKDEGGATLVEYSVLIGMITALLILLVLGVGDWASDAWTSLCTAVSTTGNPCVTTGAD